MDRRSIILWSLSTLLLAWIVGLTLHMHAAEGCREAGGRWEWRRWKCRAAPAIELRRGLDRG